MGQLLGNIDVVGWGNEIQKRFPFLSTVPRTNRVSEGEQLGYKLSILWCTCSAINYQLHLLLLLHFGFSWVQRYLWPTSVTLPRSFAETSYHAHLVFFICNNYHFPHYFTVVCMYIRTARVKQMVIKSKDQRSGTALLFSCMFLFPLISIDWSRTIQEEIVGVVRGGGGVLPYLTLRG